MKQTTTIALALCVLGGAVWAQPAATNESSTAAADVPAGDVIAAITNVSQLAAMEKDLNDRMRALSTDLYRTLAFMRESKQRALQQDPELKALNKEIARLEEKVERLFREKHPELDEWEDRRNRLVDEHEAIRDALLSIRTRKADLLEGQPEMRRVRRVKGQTESEIQSDNTK